MDKKNRDRQKILTNGFSFTDYLAFRKDYAQLKATYNYNITKNISFVDTIIGLSRAATDGIVTIAILGTCFIAWGIYYDIKQAIFFSVLLVAVFSYAVWSNARDQKHHFMTELKLIKLAIRLKMPV